MFCIQTCLNYMNITRKYTGFTDEIIVEGQQKTEECQVITAKVGGGILSVRAPPYGILGFDYPKTFLPLLSSSLDRPWGFF